MNDPDFIPWLLAAPTPSIRYLTLRACSPGRRTTSTSGPRGGRWPRPGRSRRSWPGLGMKKLFSGSQSDCDAGVLLRSSLMVKRHRSIGVHGLV